MHSITRGAFNIVSNIETSVGLAIAAMIVVSVNIAKEGYEENKVEKLMKGY
jgi:hypothetical protein